MDWISKNRWTDVITLQNFQITFVSTAFCISIHSLNVFRIITTWMKGWIFLANPGWLSTLYLGMDATHHDSGLDKALTEDETLYDLVSSWVYIREFIAPFALLVQ